MFVFSPVLAQCRFRFFILKNLILKIMAKIQYGVGVTEMRGSVGGACFSASKQGPYVRKKSTPIDPYSVLQNPQRSNFQSLSQRWRSLPDANKLSYVNLAKTYPQVNSLGQTYYMSGFNLFMCLCRRLQLTGSMNDSMAPDIALNNLVNFASWSVDVDATPGSVDMKFTFSPVIAGTEEVVIESSGPVSAGISRVVRWKFVRYINDTFLTGDSIKTFYLSAFGRFPAAGEIVWFRCHKLGTTSGFISTNVLYKAISHI